MDHEEMVAREILKLARKVTRRRNHHLRAVDLTTEQADALIFLATSRTVASRLLNGPRGLLTRPHG
ncbi:hypothetical protein [Lactiplantibacillus carotarum]|uniref:hypothetical protein n=1 Tax=Lactiplantibacillus carotarum TaxID=2993456 RepID=UPI00298EDA35|nr:hypothetical protein [Lactiplantibacillus carotarum]